MIMDMSRKTEKKQVTGMIEKVQNKIDELEKELESIRLSKIRLNSRMKEVTKDLLFYYRLK